jgi:hypothetical protein
VALVGGFWALRTPVLDPSAVAFDAPKEILFRSPLTALRRLPRALSNVWVGSTDLVLLIELALCMALIALPRARTSVPLDDGARRRRAVLLAIFTGVCTLYFALPERIRWLWLLDERYAPVAAMLLPACLRRGDRPWQRWLPQLGAALVALSSAVWIAQAFHAFSREAAGFDELVERMPPRRSVLMLIFDERSVATRLFPYHHFGAFYRARKGGIVEHAFVELPQSPLRYRPQSAPPRRPFGSEWEPELVVALPQALAFDFLLVRGDPAQVPEGRWRRVDGAGLWSVFARE